MLVFVHTYQFSGSSLTQCQNKLWVLTDQKGL